MLKTHLKQVILIIVSLFIFISCSNDDESSNTTEENISIVGVWNYIQRVNTCSNGDKEVFVFSDCFQMSTLTFSNNGNYENSEYQNESGECEPTDFDSGEWELVDDILILRSSDNNSRSLIELLTIDTLIIGSEDEDMTCDDGNIITLTSFEFIRAE